MALDLTSVLGTEPVADAEEEAFLVFSQEIPSQSLGFIDAQAPSLDMTIAGRDLTIHQSHGLLTSDRKEGTTGAVVWKVTPLFAEWISSPSNLFFTNGLLNSSSNVLELGAGVSGIVALTLGPLVASYTATDQPYVLKLLRQNISSNLPLSTRKSKSPAKAKSTAISAAELDWESSDTSHLAPPDLIIACDCIYNESLIEPLNSTCAALCGLRAREEAGTPTLVLVAQQLRSHEVFEAWLKSFAERFWCWQVPDGLVGEGLREGSGMVVHLGVLKQRW